MRRFNFKWFLVLLPLLAFAAYAQKSVIQGVQSNGVIRDVRTSSVGEINTVTKIQSTSGGSYMTLFGDDSALGGEPVISPLSLILDTGDTIRIPRSDTSGRQIVVGPAASGAAATGSPLLTGGSDGTNARSFATDSSGRQVTVGAAAAGAAVAGNPLLMGGSDGTNARSLSTDSSGRQVVIGAAAAGAAVTGNPLLFGGSDGTNVRAYAVDTGGRPQVNISDDTDVALVNGSGQLEVTAANALPTGLDWVYATTTDFSNCAAGGSSSSTIAAGTWQLGVFDETVWVCYAATCAAGGRRVPASTMLVIKVPSTTTISCRSTGSTGDLEYTKLQ